MILKLSFCFLIYIFYFELHYTRQNFYLFKSAIFISVILFVVCALEYDIIKALYKSINYYYCYYYYCIVNDAMVFIYKLWRVEKCFSFVA